MTNHWAIRPVKEVINQDEGALRQVVKSGQPALFRGMVKDWRAFDCWASLDYLEEALENALLPVSLFPDRRYDDARHTPVEMTFKTFRRRALDPCGAQAEIAKVNAKIAAVEGMENLMEDFSVPNAVPESAHTRLFLGRDYASQTHYHSGGESLLCTAVGKKRVFLFKPSDFDRLYPFQWNQNRFWLSRIIFDFDSTEFDVAEYPRALGLNVIEAVVHPGDALYIPMYWPHLVFSYGLSISLTFFWKATLFRKWANPLVLRRTYLRRKDPR